MARFNGQKGGPKSCRNKRMGYPVWTGREGETLFVEGKGYCIKNSIRHPGE